MSEQPKPASAPQSNRTKWIIGGAIGCVVLCLLLVCLGGVITAATGNLNFSLGALPSSSSSSVSVKPPLSSSASVASSLPSSSRASSPLPSSSTGTGVQPPATASAGTGVQPPATTSAGTGGLPPVASSSPASASALSSSSSSAVSKAPAGPTGKILFSKKEGDRPEDQYLWIMNADGTGAKKIVDRASHAFFSPDGTKIAYYHWTDGIYTANTDGSNAKKIVGDTFTGGDYGSGVWSHDGNFVFFTAQPAGKGNIVIDRASPTDGAGRTTVVVGESPSLSPDGKEIVFHTCRGSECGIYRSSSNPGSEAIKIITDDGGLPAWSPDGKRIVYQKDVNGQKQLFIVNVDGTGSKQLTSGAALHVDATWSLDGSFIFYRSPEGGDWGIWVMNADGTNPKKLIGGCVPVNWPYERLAVGK